MNNSLLLRTVERLENSDSQGNTSTEDLLVINNWAASLDATEIGRLIRVPQARSFFDESSSDDISERLLRTFTQDVQIIDETLEALLENTFSESREEGASFIADITSHSWKIQVQSTTMDEANISSVLNTYSFNDNLRSPSLKVPRNGTFDSLKEEVYFEQPITLLALGKDMICLYDIVQDQEDFIRLESLNLSAACVLPDGQIVATGELNSTYIYHANAGWQRIGDLIYPRFNHAIVFHKGTVYVIGGVSRKEVEKLGPDNVWEEISPLNNARSFPAAVSMQGKLYVVGGVREIPNYASVEVLTDLEWQVLNVKIPNNLSGHCCFFTPEHEIVIIGGAVIIAIDERLGTVTRNTSCCHDQFVLNSWSYLEEENKVIVWGTMMIWKYDIATADLEAFKEWNGGVHIG